MRISLSVGLLLIGNGINQCFEVNCLSKWARSAATIAYSLKNPTNGFLVFGVRGEDEQLLQLQTRALEALYKPYEITYAMRHLVSQGSVLYAYLGYLLLCVGGLGRCSIYFSRLVALNYLRHIRLLQVLRLFIAQLELDRFDRLVDPLLTSESHNRVDAFLLYRPRDSHQCHTDASLLRNLFQPVHNVFINLCLFAPNEGFEEVVGLFTLGGSIAPRSGEDAAGDWRPWNAAYTRGAAVGDHLPLFFAVDEVVIVLHGDELVPGQMSGAINPWVVGISPSIGFSNILQRLKFPRRHRAGSYVSHFAALHHIVQRLHDLLLRRLPVQSVNL